MSLIGGGHDGGCGPPQRPGGGGAQPGGGQARARDHLRRHQQVDIIVKYLRESEKVAA